EWTTIGNAQVSGLAAIVRVLLNGVIVTDGVEAPATGTSKSLHTTAPARIACRVQLIVPPWESSSRQVLKYFKQLTHVSIFRRNATDGVRTGFGNRDGRDVDQLVGRVRPGPRASPRWGGAPSLAPRQRLPKRRGRSR